MSEELVAYFFEREDADTVAELLHGEVRRDRFQGEDDDEDHPWVVLIPADADAAVVEPLVAEHDGWLDAAMGGSQPSAEPEPLPTAPRRLKRARQLSYPATTTELAEETPVRHLSEDGSIQID
ncbi:hypothetical protein [Kribbella sp. CA-293567]|uniref:hypothetical protein n=1 Tax=Kribbella sp. CA-293567 TaxID=3002436 RepID=UPI0022DD0AF5|nr:hypothetical protein [Kribbella sp. CA-293567]WBQ07748.1 hypothetical protein OX958_13320 [Kribbella sp. CA-293567]